MHMSAHLAVMLKESRFSPSEADRLVADAQQGFDEDNDQTGLTYQLLMKLVMNGMPRREILISKYSPLMHPIIGILNIKIRNGCRIAEKVHF